MGKLSGIYSVYNFPLVINLPWLAMTLHICDGIVAIIEEEWYTACIYRTIALVLMVI